MNSDRTTHDLSRSKISICFYLLLVFAFSVQAQESPIDKLQSQFIRYQENALQEKIFIHTSKDNFFTSETMFFKVYTVDGMLHQPLSLSTVAYFELLNSSNQSVAQIKVLLSNGSGSGSLTIPDSLSTGRYRILSYTSWMRNFSPDFFFSKDISIVNPLKKPIIGRSRIATDRKPSIQFFPEGGNLVWGLKSKIAFQTVDSNGKGTDFKGFILDEANDTIAKFQPLKFGIGNFSFTPQKGKTYTAFVKVKDGSITSHKLPVPYDEGYVMTLNHEIGRNEISVIIQSNKSGVTGKKSYLVLQNRQRIRKLMTSLMDASGKTLFTIPVQTLDEGINHFTFFDEELNPIAERLYFKQLNQVLKIEVNSIKPSYTKRANISATLAIVPDNRSLSAKLSLSVFKIDDLQQFDSTNIVTHLLLTSDLKGRVESPFYYTTHGGKEKEEAIDNLMLTHGWSRFNWQDVVKDKWPIAQFGPDNEGMTIRALITNEKEEPIANKNVFLSSSAKDNQFYAARSNSKGLLQFYTRNLFGKTEIVFQNIGDTSKFNFTIVSPFTEHYPSHVFNSLTVPEEQETLVRSYSIHRQVQGAFTTSTLKSIMMDSIPFFGKPDKSYLLSDYVSFPQIKDALKEYVSEVIVRKKDDKFHLFIYDKTSQTVFENEPFILLDGVPIFDTDRIATLPQQNVTKLDIVNKKFFYGFFVFNGIISLTSERGKFSGFQMNPEAVVFDYEGLQQHQEFYSPRYNQTSEERLPDFRNVLFWQPEIITGADGRGSFSFFTSDLPGKYIGVINGLTADGVPGSTTFRFEVK